MNSELLKQAILNLNTQSSYVSGLVQRRPTGFRCPNIRLMGHEKMKQGKQTYQYVEPGSLNRASQAFNI